MDRAMRKKPDSVSPLAAHLGYWLRFVSNHVSHGFSLKLRERGVTVAEWAVLRELYDVDACAPNEIASRMGMTRGTISKLVDRLAEKTLVTRTGSEEDRRYQIVALTAKGRRLVPDLSALADRNDAEFFGHLSAGEQRNIKRSMVAIVRRHGLSAIPID
jgi:DNA-binding MarR family transcriptional regulator